MALPASGYLQLGTDGATGRSVNSEFGYGNDFASYQGVYCGKAGSAYQLPLVGNPFAMDQFYSTSRITGGSQSFSSSQNYTIPVYNVINITVNGAGGGGTGQPGYYQSPCSPTGQVTPGSSGAPGGSSSFGGYVSAGGGGSDQGGSSSSNSYTNPIQGGSGPPSGSTIFVTVGSGGGGGAGGCFVYQKLQYWPVYYNYGCACWDRFNTGYTGANGSVQISWS